MPCDALLVSCYAGSEPEAAGRQRSSQAAQHPYVTLNLSVASCQQECRCYSGLQAICTLCNCHSESAAMRLTRRLVAAVAATLFPCCCLLCCLMLLTAPTCVHHAKLLNGVVAAVLCVVGHTVGLDFFVNLCAPCQIVENRVTNMPEERQPHYKLSW